MKPLFDFQKTGRDWLTTKRHALLADEMGLGKSAQSITAADNVNAKNILILCPAIGRYNWFDEFYMFSPLDRPMTLIINGKDKPEAHGVTACSYDLAVKPKMLDQLRAIDWDLMICDEAHYLKEPSAARTAAVLGKSGLIHRAKRAWFLTGTPAPNNYAELWVLLHVMGRYKYKYESFMRRFCTGYESGYGFKITGGKNQAALREMLTPIMLRRLKVDVMKDLPPIRYSHINIEPGPVDEEIYFLEFVKFPKYKARLQKQADAVNAVMHMTPNFHKRSVAMEAIKERVATLRRYNGLQKVQETVEIVKKKMANGLDKLVIFAIHRDVIHELRQQLSEFKPVTVFGGTPPPKRNKNVKRFKEDPKCKIFLGQVHAAGTTISLTNAHTVIFIEADWVPGNNAQAAMRVHRIGQTMPVDIIFMKIINTIDDDVMQTLKRKTETLTQLFDAEQSA